MDEDEISFGWFFIMGGTQSGHEVNYWMANDSGSIDQMVDSAGNTLIFNG